MAVHTSQSVVKAAGGNTARGRSRGTGTPPPAPGRFRRGLSTHWYAWTMVAPVVVVISVIIGYPLLRGIYLSMTDADERNVARSIGVNELPATYEFVGVDNYVDALTGSQFLGTLGWTLVWTVACVSITFAFGMALANLLNRRIAGRSAYRMALILPWAIPGFVSVFAWRFLYNEERGLLNKILGGAGFDAVPWLNDPTVAKFAVIAVNVWLGIPFMMVALLGGLQSIPSEQYEAAEMDGATAWQRFRHITLPGLRPVSTTVVLLSTIWTFNMFPVIFLLTRGGPGEATQILVTQAYKFSFEISPRDYAQSSTWGVLILVLLMLFAVIYRRVLRSQGDNW
ncbi:MULTISPECIES: sugar ABC transporter permease [Streptomyces]|uniref:Sugar ABC transporter permease n=1 Tax=Streptomyces rhizosphaericola TaxID=2564098 RepID=A0ABY2PIJ3_9ACTN|nr:MULTISPECIES: sugar ABC transporter permease [Streptomyces]ARI54888.1 ABC transporter permease [Streptomyces sp. S8]MYU00737.1 ABC transporter permease subunit [Streptomyces sp. SID8350]NGO82983.1 ABC transporter permease subunit [Streptomyces sp. 196(2019)]PWS40199.1 sugar ABC transporter permease [Streptomyces sp. ZEA17I]TGZ10696.1 sugar ABC transporter permease [Streptomyces rhizosphaericola]